MNDYPTGKLIDKFIEIRDYVSAKEKELEDHLKTYKDGMENIKNELLDRLNKEAQQSFKSTSGAIAFKQLKMYTRVTNREEWISWLATHWDEGRDMLTTHVSKDAIKSYTEDGKGVPAGVEITQVYDVNIRKG